MASEKVVHFTPISFLENIKDDLDDKGGITDNSIDILVSQMKQSQVKLVPKSMALTIISMSSLNTQTKLCESGVWNILFQWLQDGLKHDTTCFVVEILKLYLRLPITFNNLKSNACPKLIKKLTKCGNEDIVNLSKEIYVKWKEVVVENTNTDVPPTKKIKTDDKLIKTINDDKKKLATVKVKNTTMRTAGIENDLDLKNIKKSDSKLTDEVYQKMDKRKVIELHESKNFINSITFNTAPPKKKKKRAENSLNKSASDVNEEVTIEQNTPNTKVIDEPSQKIKKRVSWAPSDSLQTIKYFELDENERVNVNRISIEEMRRKEKLMEKQNVSRIHLSENDDDASTEKWVKPVLVTGIEFHESIDSLEKKIQSERENKVLKEFYFSKDDIPPTPSEPDVESYDVQDPKIIPTNDNLPASKPQESVENSKLLIFSEKDGNEKATLRPDVANLLKTMTQTNATKTDNTKTDSNADGTVKIKLINIIRSRYPDVDPEKLSSEEVCKLLEPLKDQLKKEGILSPQTSASISIPPPNYLNPPPNQWYPEMRPQFHPVMPQRQFGNRPRPFNPRQFNSNARTVCKYFANTGFCQKGNNCSFHHVTPDFPPVRPFNQNRQ